MAGRYFIAKSEFDIYDFVRVIYFTVKFKFTATFDSKHR